MIKSLGDIKEPKVSELGGKGYSLAALMNNGFDVPEGFVILSCAFFEYLKLNNIEVEKIAAEIKSNNLQEKYERIRNLILAGNIPQELVSRVRENLSRLGLGYVCIRSSAVSEDSLKASFAGLHDTFLNIKADPNLVLENVKMCWASLFNERAVTYRIKKEIPHFEGMAVVVEGMVPAQISGITFTVHPIDEKSLLIEASYGIGDMIVSGSVEPDDYVVDRKTLEVTNRKVGRKDKMSSAQTEGIKVIDVEKELAQRLILSDNIIKKIAKICLNIEEIFNYPQDVEWCISNNKIWLLQSRAITAAKHEKLENYDNSLGQNFKDLKIGNELLRNTLNEIVTYILHHDSCIALGLGGSYATGKNIDIYSDLDLFLIADIPTQDFKTIVEEIKNLFRKDIFMIERGEVRYLGNVYNIIFPSLTYFDLFINNKNTYEPCYLTPHMKIIVDKDGWLTKVRDDSVKYMDEGYSILLCNSYGSFILHSIKLLHSIKRNEFLNIILYINRIVDSLLYLIRIDADELGNHPHHPRTHFEAEITNEFDFSDLYPSCDMNKNLYIIKRLLEYYLSYLDKISNKCRIKRNTKIEKNIKSEFDKVIREMTK